MSRFHAAILLLAFAASDAAGSTFVAPPVNDRCANAIQLGDGTQAGTNVEAQTDVAVACDGGTMGSEVWYRYQAPAFGTLTVGFCAPGARASFDTMLAGYVGDCGALTLVACSDSACGSGAEMKMILGPGQTAYIAVGGKNAAQGTFTLASSFLPPPANNDCTGALALNPGLTIGHNNAATTGFQTGTCGSMGSDVWYSLQAPCNGLFDVGFCAPGAFAGFDSVIALFSGPCFNVTQIACSDDVCGTSAHLQIPVVIGQTVYVAVGGKNGAEGPFTLYANMDCGPAPPNDECSTATQLVAGVANGTNGGAGTSAVGSTCPGYTSDVWYRFEAPSSGALTVGFCGPSAIVPFDAILGLYDGSCGSLQQIACSDDQCGSAPQVAAALAAGQVVYVRIGSKNSAQGNFTFDVGFLPNDTATTATPVAEGLINGTNSGTVTTDPLASTCGGNSDVWFDYRPSSTGIARIGFCAPGAGAPGLDATLTVYSAAYGAMTELTCNDNRCGLLPEVAFPVVAKQSYLVRVASKTAVTGPFTLAIACQSAVVRQTELLGLANVSGSTQVARINTFPWSFELVGSTGIANLRGLDADPATGALYATRGPSAGVSDATLYSLDPASGAATVIGTTTVKSVPGLAFDPAGSLYGSATKTVGFPVPPLRTLVRIDPSSGSTTVIGDFDATGTIKGLEGLACDPAGGILYGASNASFDGTPGDLFTIDKATGAATLNGSLAEFGTQAPLTAAPAGLAFDASGTLYGAMTGGDGRVIAIDPAALEYVVYGDAGSVSIDGLAASCPGNEVYGRGCAGAGGFTPLLVLDGCTRQGATIQLAIRNALGGSAAMLALGVAPAAIPYAGACTLNVAPLLPVTIVVPLPAGGPGLGAITIPAVVPVIGAPVDLALQALVADPVAPGGLAASNGLAITVR